MIVDAVGPHEGRKAFTLQTVPASEPPSKPFLLRILYHGSSAPV
jgi:hypothetical protein